MHQSRITGRDAYITTEINKIVAEGSGYITTEVGVNPGYVAAAGQINPIYDTWGYDANGARRANNNFPRITEFALNTMVAMNDTFRLKRFAYAPGNENGSNPGVSAKPEIAANYLGTPFGSSAGYLPAITSAIGPILLIKGQFGKPFVLMTSAEVQFSLAEAKQRFTGVTLAGTALSYYTAGVTESFRASGANIATASDLLNSGKDNADFTASTNKLNAIAYQKWVALGYFSGLEAWTEYRKSNYPVTPQSKNYLGPERPVRLYYPGSELGSNGANVTAQGTIDPLKTKIFWDID